MPTSGSRDNLIAAALVGTVVVVLGYASGIGVRPGQDGDQPVIAIPRPESTTPVSSPAPTTPASKETQPEDDDTSNHNGVDLPNTIVGPNNPNNPNDPADPGEPNDPTAEPTGGQSPSPSPSYTPTVPPPGPTPTKVPTTGPSCPPGIVESLPVVGPVVEPILDPLEAALLGQTCLLAAS